LEFSKRKLPKEAAEDLSRCPIDSVQPFRLIFAPAYVYLAANEKFVSVKAPLDFFLPNELERLKQFQNLHFPQFESTVQVFRNAGRRVRSFLTLRAATPELNELTPAPFEISDSVLRTMGSLWWRDGGDDIGIEPFMAVVFCDELLGSVPEEPMVQAREQDVARFEKALIHAAWTAFLALHLGYCNLEFVKRLRDRVFLRTVEAPTSFNRGTAAGEVEDLVEAALASVEGQLDQRITAGMLDGRADRASRKLCARLRRVKDELAQSEGEPPSIRGEKGFIDV